MHRREPPVTRPARQILPCHRGGVWVLGDVALVGARHPQCGTHPPRHPHTVTPTLAPTVETPLSQSDPGHTGPTFLTSYDGNAHFLRSYTRTQITHELSRCHMVTASRSACSDNAMYEVKLMPDLEMSVFY